MLGGSRGIGRTTAERLAADGAFGAIDIVVVCGAVGPLIRIVDTEPEDFDTVRGVNARSAFFALREAGRRVRDEGRIIAPSTAGTALQVTDLALYLGTKAPSSSSSASWRGSSATAMSSSTHSHPDRRTPSCCPSATATSHPPCLPSTGSEPPPTSPTSSPSSPAPTQAGSPARTSAPPAASSDPLLQ